MFEIMASTVLVKVVAASVVNEIISPTFNSDWNKVPEPVTAAELFETEIVPVSCVTEP